MQHVEPQQGFLSDRGIAQQQKLDLFAYERRIPGDGCPHRDGPESQLVPGQQIAGEAQKQRDQQQPHAQHPVEFPRLLVSAGEEHAAQVQEHDGHHAVRRPAVHIAQEDAEGHRAAQVQHAVVRLRGGGHVVEHQEHAGDHQNQKQEERHQPQPQRVEGPQRVAIDLHRVHVQEEIGEAGGCPLEIVGGQRIAKNRTPDIRGELPHGGEESGFLSGVAHTSK